MLTKKLFLIPKNYRFFLNNDTIEFILFCSIECSIIRIKSPICTFTALFIYFKYFFFNNNTNNNCK